MIKTLDAVVTWHPDLLIFLLMVSTTQCIQRYNIRVSFSCSSHHYGETRALPLDAENPAPPCTFPSYGSWMFVSMNSDLLLSQKTEVVNSESL